MLPDDHPGRIQIAFDDHRLVANAGLILPATLGRHLGLPELVDRHLDLGRAPGRANTGDKVMTLVASALAGGDCIDDADVLRVGGTARRSSAAWSRRHPPWVPSCLGPEKRALRPVSMPRDDFLSRPRAEIAITARICTLYGDFSGRSDGQFLVLGPGRLCTKIVACAWFAVGDGLGRLATSAGVVGSANWLEP